MHHLTAVALIAAHDTVRASHGYFVHFGNYKVVANGTEGAILLGTAILGGLWLLARAIGRVTR